MNKCQNPECEKEIPEGKHYCNEECLKRHQELKREEKSKVTKALENPYDNQGKITTETHDNLSIEEILTNPVYQRGSGYRAEKLKAIWKARQKGVTEEQIIKLLLRGGLTRQTANVMMQDSREAYE